jgi:protoheme IX farnesyltransferase
MTSAHPVKVETDLEPRSTSRTAFLVSLVQLTKPGLGGLVMVTALAGALSAPGPRSTPKVLIALIGTALVVGAANTLNMYIERQTDCLMTRTRTRPLPTGRVSPEVALIFGILLATHGLPLLSLLVNPLTALLTAAALASYVFVYTPLKQVSPLALHVGAVPGALPPLIGWASVHGTLAAPAWALFAILFLWQLPHFLAIAIFRREEYARAGHRVLPVVKGVPATKRAIVAYSALFVAATVAPYFLGMVSVVYLVLAAASGLAFFAYSLAGLRETSGDRWAKKLFRYSMPHLVLVMTAFVLSAH